MLMRFVDQGSRREFLQFGMTGLAGALVARGARGREPSRRPPGFGRAKSVILVYASGGQSQLDMWDPKPDAPLDVRGEFSPIASSLSGVHFCEYLPRVASIADRLTVVRSMSHEDLDHGTATYLALTGRYHRLRSANPPPSPDDLPTYGSILKRVRPSQRFPYDAVHVNGPALVPRTPSPGQSGGILGRAYEPLVVGDVTEQAIALPGLSTTDPIPTLRLTGRSELKHELDRFAAALSRTQQAGELKGLYRQALEVLADPKYRTAFDLSHEPDDLRDQYGRHRSGQACLLARRLVEAGVPWITVVWNHSNRGQDIDPTDTNAYGWDTHNDIFEALKVHLLPRFDVSFSTLLADLDRRGLLEETLVVCMGEFGRAPRVAFEKNFAGRSPGRKHWASVYSMVAAGAGVQRGAVVGASDRLGAEPVTERYGPWDVAATMFSALGIPWDDEYLDDLDRPYPITVGRPIEALYGS